MSPDVRSFYTSIPSSEGIKVFKISSENFPRRTVITTFLSLTLTLKKFCVRLQRLFTNKTLRHGDDFHQHMLTFSWNHGIFPKIYIFTHF